MAIAILAARHPENRTRLGSAGACEVVVQTLRAHYSTSAAVAHTGCGAIGHLARSNPANIFALAYLGARDLVAAIASDPAMERVQRRARDIAALLDLKGSAGF